MWLWDRIYLYNATIPQKRSIHAVCQVKSRKNDNLVINDIFQKVLFVIIEKCQQVCLQFLDIAAAGRNDDKVGNAGKRRCLPH